MKETYTEKFVGLDFSQNISLRPKDEVQSAHPSEMRYHDHLSDDTNYDAVFVDYVLRNIIARYGIENEDFWIQSDNTFNQYESKHSLGLLQQLLMSLV